MRRIRRPRNIFRLRRRRAPRIRRPRRLIIIRRIRLLRRNLRPNPLQRIRRPPRPLPFARPGRLATTQRQD